MIDHVVLNVSDLKASRAFYEKALEPLGMDLLGDYQGYIGFGKDRVAFFWLTARKETSQNVHVAFGCDERLTVDAFYEAAMAAGGEDNGGPGVREIYHADYYGAFVLDPDGNNIEAVCHKKE